MVSLSFLGRKKNAPKLAPAVPPKPAPAPSKAPAECSMQAQTTPDPATNTPFMTTNTQGPAISFAGLSGHNLPEIPGVAVPSQESFYSSLGSNDAALEQALQEARLRPPAPPALNTDLPVFSEPTHPRASFIRHSRVLSGTSTIAGGLNSMVLPLQTLRHRQKTIITDLPAELLPVVNLANAQRLRHYASGPISLLTEDGLAWLAADATLTGTELLLWFAGHLKPRYLNIQDCSIVPSRGPVPGGDLLYDLLVLQDYDFNVVSLRFADALDMHTWLAAMQLAKFEHTSLNEAFTAVVLSWKGPQLSDIYTLLAHKKRFTRFEWCNLRLPQVSNKWIKVFMAIVPGDAKKNGRVEIYASDKITKKNLILYVNDVFSVYNVYPEDHRMIDFNLIMKLDGEAFVNRLYEHLFSGNASPTSPKPHSRRSSVTSFGSLNPPTPVQVSGTRSRSTSISSTSSFFTHAPSPKLDAPVSNPGSPTTKSKHFFKKQTANNFVTTNYLYLMPEAHPGVSAIEIMLRNFVHIIDAFKLYGRPDHLNSDKKDPISMLFGLPSLPHYCYLDLEDAYGVVAANFDTARLQNWGQGEWRTTLKEYLRCKQIDTDFKGTDNIYDLFNSVNDEGDSGSIADGAISPLQSKMQSPQKNPFNMNLSGSGSSDDFQKMYKDGDSIGLGKPIDLNEDLRGYYEASNGVSDRQDFGAKSRTLHPIMDLPTPIDDAHGASYFAKERQVLS
ncbi:hypothetical protein METBIDRAFT_77610 [Metschnikowia bicuspidata var. bicuspidata NRRL YB-4993]|uniref:Skg3/CAF120-like PH-like domain-containing protein n=1 Tax=Metschnikowia bicuspidata var. bicuspidata NRRL YB-4993 TaxID=869754 RepID=A0A1A0HDH6_9ASCO|nr:hypothetical protein METBIDRAFT_77610 [Metschnikowia bicuspidata var. bicuspidata NRRL YB-4993]OBA22134.1 hypothetical protein METBIDRAFT_77610 [Metschnikowia bicuspidata var. bicuspidata NRRL YB-4993]